MSHEQPHTIAEIFERPVDRAIEEVIKVDALEPEQIANEIQEYYPTASIQEQMLRVLEAYWNAFRAPTNDIGVWVSGFFGAGKSSFAKMLGVLLESRQIQGRDAIELFSQRLHRSDIPVLLQQIREHMPTRVVVFDILKDQVAGASEYPVTTVMYRALLRSFGYAFHNLDLAELELNLEQSGKLELFKEAYSKLYPDDSWEKTKHMAMVARSKASAALHHMEPHTYPEPDSWARSHAYATITPRELADKALLISQLRTEGRNIVFVVDEIGQYTARDLKRIGDLQGVVESFGQVGQGKLWLVGTSQEKLESIVDIYESDRTELARLQDRFAHKVFLNPSDIREVASHRVLSKNGRADAALRTLFQEHSGRLRHLTQVTSTVDLPALEEDSFVHLYPLLPYQVDLLIAIVSGLRRQATGPQSMGGANRTIIKLAQQLLIHEKVGIASQSIGTLVTLDSVFDLLTTSISTEIHQEIEDIKRTFGPTSTELSVAKALSLLQFADTAHATEENLSAVLHPAVHADSHYASVRQATEELVAARKVRRGENGLKIQSAAERTWDQQRDEKRVTPRERERILKEQLTELWGRSAAQQPKCQLGGWRDFIGGLRIGNESLVNGHVPFEIHLVDTDRDVQQQIQDARAATQSNDELITWTLELTDAGDRAVEERFRSERMLSARTTGRNTEEESLIRDERRRLNQEKQRIDSELRKALCRGHIFFQGNDRSPAANATDPKVEARRVLEPAVRAIYHRFEEGGVKVSANDVKAILQSENLAGLPGAYAELGLVESDGGQTRLVTDRGPAKELLDYIRQQTERGKAPAGKELEQVFTGPPYGWPFEAIQLLVATLLRDGQITLTAQSQSIKNARSPEAQNELTNNTRFRALTVTVRKSSLDRSKLREAAKILEQRFGFQVSAITVEGVAKAAREHLGNQAGKLQTAHEQLRDIGLPGVTALGQGIAALQEINASEDEVAIHAFLENADTLDKALPRAQALEERLTQQVVEDLHHAKTAVQRVAPVLERELDPDDPVLSKASELRSQLEKETFYEHLSSIKSATSAVMESFEGLYQQELERCRKTYQDAVDALRHTPGWHELEESDQEKLLAPLQQYADMEAESEPWRHAESILDLLRSYTDAASGRLSQAQSELQRILTPEAVEISIRAVVNGSISTEEELEAALSSIRDQAEQALSDGRPVVFK